LKLQLPTRRQTASAPGVGRVVIVLRAAGVIALAVAAVVLGVRAVWRGWRRAWTRPWPDRGVNGWLLRQPGWRAALAVAGFRDCSFVSDLATGRSS